MGEHVGDRLVARPAQPGVDQVEAEGPRALADVEVDDVAAPVRRHEPSAAWARSRCGSTRTSARAARRPGCHQVAGDPQEQRRLAAPGLGDQQQVAAQQVVGQRDRDASGPGGRRRRSGSRAATVPGSGRRGGRWCARGSGTSAPALGQVPQAGQLAGVEDRPRAGRRQRRERAQVAAARVEAAARRGRCRPPG